MIINQNLPALNIVNRLQQRNRALNSSMEKLTSGLRINKAADDAAGLAISEKMNAQVRGLRMAQKNIQDGISLIQVAQGGLSKIKMPPLKRMRELAIKAANDTLTDSDRKQIQKEIEELKSLIDDISRDTEFNGIKLLNVPESSIRPYLMLQIGANSGENFELWLSDVRTITLGIDNINVETTNGAEAAMQKIKEAAGMISSEKVKYGSYSNALEHSANNVANYEVNLSSSLSTIRDVDMEKEIMRLSKDKIINQAAQAMLVQANQQPQRVLQLLQ